MMYALAVLLLIAINIHGQKEECTLAPELIKVYEDFHHERYPTGRYVTVKFKNDVYEKAKEELNEPGKYSNDRTYKSIRRSMSLPNDDTPIEKQVENVLRKKFVLKVHQKWNDTLSTMALEEIRAPGTHSGSGKRTSDLYASMEFPLNTKTLENEVKEVMESKFLRKKKTLWNWSVKMFGCNCQRNVADDNKSNVTVLCLY
ncbi:hypothetical protein Q1695_004493 [Nippostrongylus brasiliensis]|nr:hypothetical protein Q1695_004493 [Nippostrongylus brasiliensis]